jgi:carboxyl-terminal processing protease
MRKLRILATLCTGSVMAVVILAASGNLRPSQASQSYQDLDLMANVLHLVKSHYVETIDDHTLIEGALKGMLDTLDPHTSYLPPKLYEEVQLDTRGEFEGLGIEITKRDGYVTVVAPIDGTPASKAGIKARDQIVAVCPDTTQDSCKSTQDMNLLEAVNLMRGPRGTRVMIQVLRAGWQGPQPFVIRRASIRVTSVTMHLVEDGIPYVRLSQFQERTASDLSDALERAEQQGGPFRGLVLDLRDNPGGLLEQAVRVADIFLSDGLIVFSEGRGGGNHMDWHAKAGSGESDYPIVVLVNGGSASASEIVAGALQDHGRGLILGSETFGKGSVQTIIPLDNKGGLRLTTALYYLPSGRSIQKVRIQPDVAVEPYTEAQIEALRSEDPERKTFGEEDLDGSLKQDGDESREEKDDGESEAEGDARRELFERQLPVDRQLTRAIELLKSWNIFSKLGVPEEVSSSATFEE